MSDVKLYTKPGCGPCIGVKHKLQANSVKYVEEDARQHVEYLQSLGAGSAPVLVKDGALVKWWDSEDMKRVVGFGKLP